MAAKPDWRKIEAVLIELLREEGFEIEQVKGNSYISIDNGDTEHDICVGDFAQALADRL